jgi:CRP-like cAMP-binding protein
VSHPLIRRLSLFNSLSVGDGLAIADACKQIRKVGAGSDLIREGDLPSCIYVMLKGWAVRYKILENGRRQISAFLLPGDLFDLNLYILRAMDHSVGAISSMSVAEISPTGFEELIDHHPRITKALMLHQLAMVAVERESVSNVGQRNAYQRVAHLFAELFARLRPIGETDGNSFRLPPTQSDLADATGMTVVHVNRMLGRLRREKLIRLDRKKLTLLNPPDLRRVALFDDNYLHLHERGGSAALGHQPANFC